ncbi:MAG: NfeD family protein [Pseudomonadota bacterium]
MSTRRAWWSVMLVSTAVIGLTVAFLLDRFTGLHKLGFLGALLFAMFVGDVLVALGVQKIAPTKISIGPGERATRSDLPAETATAISHFDAGDGRVEVRGETWKARAEPGAVRDIRGGDVVQVTDREGLTLVVSRTES